ncbi:hypothetical protein P7H33_02250 [Vagococcus lutrae]|uniref:hypothetical protein n=1 Tax=Vagococcus lutrae TaxID=81947 RepID=UPI00288E2814|nr:hypothetical protein [Vagococcus lutrae]MDT2811764.1 hypothetical protein [Vagococcus lutrae]
MVKKIDFHIHTISSDKDYDFSYSSEWLKEYVKESGLDAIAITNHDLFDKENYQQVKSDLPDITVFPGMELSLETGHVNIVFSEDKVEDLVDFSNWIKEQNLGSSVKISIEDFCNNMNNWETGIYIFELGKSNSLSVPDQLSNVCCVGGVANQLKFQIFYKNKDSLAPVLFSDAHAAKDDTESKRNDINILKNKNTYIQIDSCEFDNIKKCISDRTKVDINKDNLRNVISIENHMVSTGLNLIVGKRGTGKTKFLDRIKKQYNDEDIYEIAQFETSKSDEYIERQRKEQGHTALEKWKNQYDSQFRGILDYLDNYEENYENEVDRYLESVKKFSKETAESKSTLKYKLIKETNYEKISTSNLEDYLNRLREFINNSEIWSLLTDAKQKKKVFIETYEELRILYIKKQQVNDIRKSVNGIIQSVKDIVTSKTGISPVMECEFSKIIQQQQTEKQINKFMNKIIKEIELKKENIFGYQIIVKLNPYVSAEQLQKSLKTKEAVNNDLVVPYKNNEYIKFLRNLQKKRFFNRANLIDYLLHLEVKLLDSDGVPASGGQAVGFALMMRLDEAKNKPIILIDEPEASLDNAYIKNELIKAIRGLSHNSTVFVVTHNSTLGALLNPDYLIVTAKDESKEYSVFSGEFSSCRITNYSSISENSYEKFVEAMEAGIETYEKKGEVYASLKN